MMAFDARWEGSHGIGRFATELRKGLPEFSPISLLGRPSDPFDPLFMYRYLKKTAPRLFFSPGFNPPLGRPCPFVFCVHDLNHLYIDENSNLLKRAYYRHIVRPAIHRADRVVTGSEFSKSQICEWSGVDANQVVAVGYGVSKAFGPEGTKHSADGRPYFLSVGNEKAHKNAVRTIQAFASAFINTEFLLLFTGSPSSELQTKIQRLGIVEQVRHLGSVSDEELAGLYRGALALVFVSLYEGFGLPIIEAMACGTPVLSSTATAMPEVAGDAAILVDPFDVDAMARGMRGFAYDRELRQEMRHRGFRRSVQFSWERTLSKVKQVTAECV